MSALLIAFVATYASNMPFEDEFAMARAMAGTEPNLERWLWEPHNEHRLPLPKLVLLGLYRICGNDFRGALYFNALVLCVLAACMMLTARALRGRTAYTDAFFPLAFLHLGHFSNVLSGWQIQFILFVGLAAALLVVIVFRAVRTTSAAALLGAGCLLSLPLCGGTGVACTPALALWFVWTGSSRRVGAFFPRCVLVLASIAALALAACAFPASKAGPPSARGADLADVARTSLEFMSMAFGPPLVPGWQAWGVGLLVLIGACAASLCRVLRRSPAEAPRALGLLLFLAAYLSVALAIGWGRAESEPGIGLQLRYVTLSLPILAAIYFVLLLYAPRWGRVGTLTLVATSILMLGMNTPVGLMQGAQRRAIGRALEHDIAAGMPAFALAERYAGFPFHVYPTTLKDKLAGYLADLRDAGVGPFRNIAHDPSFREIPLRLNRGASTICEVQFALPRRVYAVRVHFAYRGGIPETVFCCVWQSPAPEGIRQTTKTVTVSATERDSVLLWVDAVVQHLGILPIANSDVIVQSASLLVPDDEPIPPARP
jgi:hypothetical protein